MRFVLFCPCLHISGRYPGFACSTGQRFSDSQLVAVFSALVIEVEVVGELLDASGQRDRSRGANVHVNFDMKYLDGPRYVNELLGLQKGLK